MPKNTSPILVVRKSDLEEQGYVKAQAEDLEVLVFATTAGIRVYHGICPHLAGPLLEGTISRDEVMCPWHEYKFDSATGKCKTVNGGLYCEPKPDRPFDLELVSLPFEETDDEVKVFRKGDKILGQHLVYVGDQNEA